ncbi:MAG: RNA methyltransferase [Clostridia bacterium]|nr:RNA methyltransferase [Clostridia bacterium]
MQAVKALATRKGRLEQQAFLCEGEHLVAEAISMCPERVRSVFIQAEKAGLYEGLLAPLAERSPEADDRPIPLMYRVPEHVLTALSQVQASQGVAAVVSAPPRAETLFSNRLVLLESVQDPGNVGTILRTIDGAGFEGCFLAGDCADPFSPKALRATMGSIFRVPMAWAADGLSAVMPLKAAGYAVIAASLDGDSFYERGPLPQKVCLMVGNEGAGLTAPLSAAATHRYRLPLRGGAESLNAAVAAAIMMYDLSYR